MRKALSCVGRALFLSTEQGAKTSVYAATAPAAAEVKHFTPYRMLMPALSIATDGWSATHWLRHSGRERAAAG